MSLFYFVSAAVGYLLGSFPTGYLVGRAHGIDIREHGSGNIGATNVVRVLGKKPGYLVFACDAIKGLLAVRGVMLWVHHAAHPASGLLMRNSLTMERVQFQAHVIAVATVAGIVAALCCILGHNFPVWLRFRGGKGVATTVGVMIGLMPAAFAVSAVVWIGTYFTSRFVSLASLLAAAILPLAVWLIRVRPAGSAAGGWPMFWFSVAAAMLIFWRHRTNIQRLLNGTEPRFARKVPAVPSPSPTP